MTSDVESIKFADLPNASFMVGDLSSDGRIIHADSATLIEPNAPTMIPGTGLRITHWRFVRSWRIEHFNEDGLLLRTKYASPHVCVEVGGYAVRLRWDADGVATAYIGRSSRP